MPPPGSWFRVTSTVPVEQLQTRDLRCPPQPPWAHCGGRVEFVLGVLGNRKELRERQSRGFCDLLERGAGRGGTRVK